MKNNIKCVGIINEPYRLTRALSSSSLSVLFEREEEHEVIVAAVVRHVRTKYVQ